MQQATQFPRWQIGFTLSDPTAAAAAADLQSDHETYSNATDCEQSSSSSRSVIETAVRVTASAESLGDLSPAADRLRREEGRHYGDGAIGLIEFQNNDGPDSASVTSSPVVVPDGSSSSDNQEIVINKTATPPVAPAVRQLVVKFDSNEDDALAELLDLPPLPEGNPRKIFHPGNTIGKFQKIILGNIIKNSRKSGFQENPSENQRITHGDFSETSQGNPITIPDWRPARNSQENNVRIFQRNPAGISQRIEENSARISQNNVIRISLKDPSMIHEGNSSWISLREMGNPFISRNSSKLDVGDPTDSQERDFPSWQWELLANSSNIAGTQAETSEPKDENKSAPTSDGAAVNADKEKGSEDTTEKKERPKKPSPNETRESKEVPVRGSRISEANTNKCCVVSTEIQLRILWLTIYYLALWSVISLLTWGLLELSLLVTSKGNYPYYMSPHSYCMTSPAIGFAGCDPEPGKVTTFENLTNIADKIDAALGKLAASVRDCDAPAAAGASLSEDTLRIPCSMERFAAAMSKKARQVLADRPALLVQVRRHFGYLPAKGPAVTVKCKSHLSLRYFSWNGTEIVESQSSGSIPTDYFPMLTRQHNVPSVLVAIYSASKDDWSGKQVTIKCTPSDGGSGESAEKSIILIVNA